MAKPKKPGKAFEDQVAELYRLLEYDVVQNVKVCEKKVDILATTRVPGTRRQHRIIVECKDERQNRNQTARVREFRDLLTDARKRGEADSAEIITRRPWGDEAKGIALDSPVDLLTYDEKLAHLIDFRSYLEQLVRVYDEGDPSRPSEPPLGDYYVDLRAQSGETKQDPWEGPVEDYVSAWLGATDRPRLAILGEYGSGKTAFCQKLARDLANAYLQAEDPVDLRLPVVINLGTFPRQAPADMQALVVNHLVRHCRVAAPSFEGFQAMNQAGALLILLDGFDEMAAGAPPDVMEANLLEIDKLASPESAKVLMTSRPEYFITAREEAQLLRPDGPLGRTAQYERLRLAPLDDEQIEAFLRRRIPLIAEANRKWTYYRDQIRRIRGLEDLAGRPVLLEMVAKTLPVLVKEGGPVDRPRLYQTYLEGELKRQEVEKRRRLLIKRPDRLGIMEALALYLHARALPGVTAREVAPVVRSRLTEPQREEFDAHLRDFLSCSFLARSADTYRFSHRSFLEYLAAAGLLGELRDNAPDMFRERKITHEVAAFLAEMAPNTRRLWAWLHSTRGAESEAAAYLGGNAATVLNLCGRSFRRARLRHAHLLAADMRGMDLRGADLNGARLWGARLEGARFTEAQVRSADLRCVEFEVLVGGGPRSPRTREQRPHHWLRRLLRRWQDSCDAPAEFRALGAGAWLDDAGQPVLSLHAWAERGDGIAAAKRAAAVLSQGAPVIVHDEDYAALPPSTRRFALSRARAIAPRVGTHGRVVPTGPGHFLGAVTYLLEWRVRDGLRRPV